MEPKEHYTSRDFKRYARKSFPNEFNLFRGIYTSSFENKTYLDANNAAHNLSVLLVGNYHKRQGGPPVWAQVTTIGVRYFQGKSDESVITLIREKHVTRIYFAAPYSSLVVSQEGKGGTAGRKAGHHVVETIINVLFLLAGLVEQVSNPDKTDMLSNFKFVCINSSKSEVQEIAHFAVPRQTDRENKKRKRSSSVHGPRIKQEEADTDVIAYGRDIVQSRDRLVQHLHSPSPAPHLLASSNPQISLLDHIRNYEADLVFKHEQEKRFYMQEIQDLQARLGEQQHRAQIYEEKAMKEKKKRKRVEEQIEHLKNQIATDKQSKEDIEVEVIAARESLRATQQHADGQRKELTKLRRRLRMRNTVIKRLRDDLADTKQG